MSSKKKLRLSGTLFEFKRPIKDEADSSKSSNDAWSAVRRIYRSEISEKNDEIDELLKITNDKDRQIERLKNQNNALTIASINANKNKRKAHNIHTADNDYVNHVGINEIKDVNEEAKLDQCEYMDVDIKAFYHQNEILRLQEIIDELGAMQSQNGNAVNQKVFAIEKKENKRLKKEIKELKKKLEQSAAKDMEIQYLKKVAYTKEKSIRKSKKDDDLLKKQIAVYEEEYNELQKRLERSEQRMKRKTNQKYLKGVKPKSVKNDGLLQKQISAYAEEIERLQNEIDECEVMNKRDNEEIRELRRANDIKEDLIYAYRETIAQQIRESQVMNEQIRISNIPESKKKIMSPKSMASRSSDESMIERIRVMDMRLSEKNKKLETQNGIIYILERQAMEQERLVQELLEKNKAEKALQMAEERTISKDEKLLMEDADFIQRIEKENERLVEALDQKKAVLKVIRAKNEKYRQKIVECAQLTKKMQLFQQIDGHHVELHDVDSKMSQKDYNYRINVLMMKLKAKQNEIKEKNEVIYILENEARALRDSKNFGMKHEKMRDFDEYEQAKIGQYEKEIRRLTKEIDAKEQMIQKEDAAIGRLRHVSAKDEKLLMEDSDFIERIEKENEELTAKLNKKKEQMAKKDLKIRLLQKQYDKLVHCKQLQNGIYSEKLMEGGGGKGLPYAPLVKMKKW